MNTKLATTLVVGALLAPAAGYAADKTDKSMTQSIKENVSDSVITTKIKAEFAKDKTVSATSIKVDTEDKGVVTLSGNAKSQAEIDHAVKLARDTNGVISVKNNIMLGEKKSVTASAKDSVSAAAGSVKENVADSVITTKIKAEFAKDKTVSAMHVKVDTDDKGAVTLSGTAKSKAESDQAARIAKGTKGVTSVKNDIMVTAPVAGYADKSDKSDKSMTKSVKENVSDAVITTKIKAEFAKDKTVSAMRVKVDTDDKGAVTLSGTAKSKAESDQAVKIAKETKGVTSVKNDITIQAK